MPMGLLARVSNEFGFNMRTRRRTPLRSDGIVALRTREPQPVGAPARVAAGPQLNYAMVTAGQGPARARIWLRFRSAPVDS